MRHHARFAGLVVVLVTLATLPVLASVRAGSATLRADLPRPREPFVATLGGMPPVVIVPGGSAVPRRTVAPAVPVPAAVVVAAIVPVIEAATVPAPRVVKIEPEGTPDGRQPPSIGPPAPPPVALPPAALPPGTGVPGTGVPSGPVWHHRDRPGRDRSGRDSGRDSDSGRDPDRDPDRDPERDSGDSERDRRACSGRRPEHRRVK